MAEIYRLYVKNTAVTYETVPPDEAEARSCMSPIRRRIPSGAGRGRHAAGYAYAGAFRERRAHRPTVQLSVYDYLLRLMPEGETPDMNENGGNENV